MRRRLKGDKVLDARHHTIFVAGNKSGALRDNERVDGSQIDRVSEGDVMTGRPLPATGHPALRNSALRATRVRGSNSPRAVSGSPPQGIRDLIGLSLHPPS